MSEAPKIKKTKSRRREELHYGSVPVYIHQQNTKMPAAGTTQALRLFCKR